MGAGAHLCTAPMVLAFCPNISAESIGMSGAGLFMLPEVGPAKFVACVSSSAVWLRLQVAAVLYSVFGPFREFAFGLCAALAWFCLLMLVCSCPCVGLLMGARFWSMQVVVVDVLHVKNQELESCSLLGEQFKKLAPSSRGIA